MSTGKNIPFIPSRIKEEPELSSVMTSSADINQVKLDALTQGKFTDCVFLVGPENGKHVTVHAVKGTMMMASPFFASLLGSPFYPPAPIRIKEVEPKIFKLVVEFIHLGRLKTPVECEDVPDLLYAADLYRMESLKMLCIKMLRSKLSVSTVWVTLQKLLRMNNIKSEAKYCIYLLVNKTERCLEHEDFLTTTSDSINFLLEQETLDLKCEWQLVENCVDWAKRQRDPRRSFRSILGKLRLMTLTPEQVSDLPDYLTHEEMQAILKNSLKMKDFQMPSTLCSTVAPRKFRSALRRKLVSDSGKHQEYSVLLIPEEIVAKDCFELEMGEKYRTETSFTNTLMITPKVDVYLTRFMFVGQLMEGSPIVYDATLLGYVSKRRDEVNYKFEVLVSKDDGKMHELFFYSKEKTAYDNFTGFYLYEPEFLPKGETVKLVFKVVVDSPSVFRNILSKDVNPFIQENLATEVFEAIHLDGPQGVPLFIHDFKYTIVNWDHDDD